MGSEKAINILYIDDEIHNLTSFIGTFRRHYTIYTVMSIIEGYEILKSTSIDIIICDYHVSADDGIAFFKSIIPEFPKPVRILLTGYAEVEVIENAIHLGYIFKCIAKPWSTEKFHTDIKEAYDYLKMSK